jgi:3',5'-cyclic-AMP phosphodiesterase
MRHSITRIAHISDVHLLAPRLEPDLRVRFLSFGRVLDAASRIRKLSRAIAKARAAGVDHVIVSGDLTESGTVAQFETLASVLDDLHIDPERITLVPGNHDAYTAHDGWARALEGPLKRYQPLSATEAGKVIDLGDVAILPLDVACHQPVTRSAGMVTDSAIARLQHRLEDRVTRTKTTLIVQHHPPYAHASRAWQWLDGLTNAPRLTALLARFPDVHVMHGHLHKIVDRTISAVRGCTRTRVFGAPALVEDDEESPRVRLYELRGGEVSSMGLAA